MRIAVDDRVYLSEFAPSDKQALVANLNDREVYERTLRVPFPYREADAEAWLDLVARMTREQGRPVHWAIRNAEGRLIGGFGFNDFQVDKSHRAEIGYSLARPYWGQGIMTAVVERASRLAFDELGLVKLVAHVFPNNPASALVLQKCGFEQEGFLRKHFAKDGQFLDARLFALVR